MIIGPTKSCLKCGKDRSVFWAPKQNLYMCNDCQREYNPPTMTFISGIGGGLWNLEVGVREKFDDIEDIEWCGWQVRCKQETLYSRIPRVFITVYHMVFNGTIACGRCIKYPYFSNDMSQCMSVACEPAAKPHRPEKDMKYPPIKSRYAVWSGLWED